MKVCDVYLGGKPIAEGVKYCNTFKLKFLGLMFVKEPGAGAFLPDVRDIHMNFVNFELRIIWLDKDFNIVGYKVAKRWRLYNGPKKAAHVLELPLSNRAALRIGDTLKMKIYASEKAKNKGKHR